MYPCCSGWWQVVSENISQRTVRGQVKFEHQNIWSHHLQSCSCWQGINHSPNTSMCHAPRSRPGRSSGTCRRKMGMTAAALIQVAPADAEQTNWSTCRITLMIIIVCLILIDIYFVREAWWSSNDISHHIIFFFFAAAAAHTSTNTRASTTSGNEVGEGRSVGTSITSALWSLARNDGRKPRWSETWNKHVFVYHVFRSQVFPISW